MKKKNGKSTARSSPKIHTGLSAKDSFFKNPDLLTQAFSQLQVENDKEYRLCLFNAALTCKDFLDVALNALWYELDSLVPLLRLLPALHIEDNAYVLSGNVSQADWDRVEQYSRKVKVFKATTPDTQPLQVAPSTYIRIAQLQSSVLLPSLRHLRCLLGTKSMSHIFLFLSPSLQSLELTNIARSENILVKSFFDTLESPVLNQIVLRTGRLSADALKSITRFEQLRSIELSEAVSMDGFFLREVLGTLPSLVTLTLKTTSESDRAYVSEELNNNEEGPKRFNTLENLHITGSLLLIQDLLEMTYSPCLKSIEIHPAINWKVTKPAKPDTEPDALTESIVLIGSVWSSTLENLVIGQRHANGSDPPRLSQSIIDVLKGLHEMRTFHLNDWRIEEIDDTLEALVTSWPKLTCLKLPVDQMFISFSTLTVVAGCCPGLRYLQIGLLAPTIPPSNPATSVLPCHTLGVLSVGSDHIHTKLTLQCRIRVARYLDLIFPSLKSIKTHYGSNSKTWSEIHELIKLCQEVRQDNHDAFPNSTIGDVHVQISSS